MSDFTLMVCDITTGAYTSILPDYVTLETGFEFSDVGSIKIDYPKVGLGYSILAADTRTEIAVLKDGVEMDDARYRIQSSSGDQVVNENIRTFNGVSLLNRFKKAIVYSGTGSTTLAQDQTFNTATPGGILKALFDQNAARGVGTVCDEITYASFSPTLDSAGNAWALSYGNITYTVGVNYLDVIRNMVDNGMIEVKMVGRDLRVYNAGGLGTDRTVIAEPVVLRKGLDYMEAPETKTNEQIAAVALIAGDQDLLLQTVDSSVATAWGRDEMFISQGGITDSTTLGVVAQNQLSLASQVRAERTRKIAVHQAKFAPYNDYRVSDYIFDDIGDGSAPTRQRIRQLILSIDQTGVNSATAVLNDKFLEHEIAVARKISGILGGAQAGGSVAIPTPTPDQDNTTPKTPASLTATSAVYVDTAGTSLAQASLSWPAVTQNTDLSTIADLDHYETQFHWDEAFASTPAASIAPGRDLESYTKRFDRRGKGYGWLGGDGGCSTRATSGLDFWAFADTNLGIADQEGRITSSWSFIHNSFVLTNPNDSSVFDAHWGYGNRFSDDDAFQKTSVGFWQADTNCAVARDTTTFYYGTASLKTTATAAGDAIARIAGGAFAYPGIVAGQQYSVMCRTRSVGTARQVALGIRWYDSGNNLLSTSTSANFTGTNSAWQRYVHVATAPANAVKAAMIIIYRSAGAAQVFNANCMMLCNGDARYQSWNDPGRATAGGPIELMCPEELGGAELTDLNDIFWVDACTTVAGKILVFYTRYSPLGVFKNQVCIGQFDGTTHQYESLTSFTVSDTFVWGNCTYTDGTYLFVFGTQDTGSGNRAMHVMRVPIGNITGGTKEYWNGTVFQTTRASSVAVYTGYSAVFGGITVIGSTFYAVVSEYGGSQMKYLTAPAITGTWTMQGAFYDQPEVGSGIVAYFPRIHRQLESNAGIPMSYSVNGSVNGVNSVGNIRYYAPKFLIGPKSTVVAGVPATPWSDSRIIPAGTTVDYIGGLPPGANFEARVRAVDYNGNASTWTNSNLLKLVDDTTPPNKPSAPILSSAFQGIRIEWDGLDYLGGPMPGDWALTEVHVSEVANFQPGPLTKVDTIISRLGGVFPYQGLVYGRTYYARFVAIDVRGNRSVPSDVASVSPEQLVDTTEIGEKLITGAKIADNSIAVRSLTVAAFEANVIPNGGFEDEATTAAGVGTGVPSFWGSSGWTWGAGSVVTRDIAAPLAGAASLKFVQAAATDGHIWKSATFPVTEGKLLAFAAKIKASRSVPAANAFQIYVVSGTASTDVGTTANGTTSIWGTPVNSAGTTAIQNIEGQYVIPTNHKFAALFIVCYQSGDGSGWTGYWDDVQVRPVGGSAFIADASILNAKIANLAVDNAKIANVSVGKLTAGILAADMTVSARIKTSDTGARVELNSAGLQAYNSAGAKTVDIAASTGSATFTGTFQTDFGTSTTPHLKMADSSDRTTIYFFGNDGLGTSGQFAFINTPLDANNRPRLGLNSGITDDYGTAGIDVRQRVFLNNDGGIALESVNIATGIDYIGGRLILGPTVSAFANHISSGAQTGGYFEVSSTGFVAQRNTPTPNGGMITGDISALWLDSLSAGNLNARLKLAANGTISWENGKWDNFVDLGAEQAIFAGSVGASAGTAWTIAYGTTRTSANLPIVTPQFNVGNGWAVTASSTTQFTVNSMNTVAGAIRFWCFRV